MNKYKVKLTMLEPILGTVPKDQEVYAAHIASKAALTDDLLAEELNSVEHIEEKGWTGFHKNADGQPFLFDYVIKGFFKDSCSALRRVAKTKSSGLTAYKKIIDGLVFVEPRQIPLICNLADMDVIERPLRAATAQGERVTLARSDTCPAGTSLEFELTILGAVSKGLLEEWLSYGRFKGLGQWRNAGWGKFEYELEEML